MDTTATNSISSVSTEGSIAVLRALVGYCRPCRGAQRAVSALAATRENGRAFMGSGITLSVLVGVAFHLLTVTMALSWRTILTVALSLMPAVCRQSTVVT